MLPLLYLSSIPTNNLALANSLIRSYKTPTNLTPMKPRNPMRYNKLHNKRVDAKVNKVKKVKGKPKTTHIPDDEDRCIAITQKGERCKMSKNTNNYCQFHRLPVSQVELKEKPNTSGWWSWFGL